MDRLFQQVMALLDEYSANNNAVQIKKTLKLLSIIIDNSEKKINLNIDSL